MAAGGDAGFHLIAGVLGAYRMAGQSRHINRADRAQHLDLFITQGLGLERYRRLHREQRQDLQQVALDHVARGPAVPVVVTGTPIHASGFGVRDLHMVNVMAVPQGFQNHVGKAQHQQVLDRFLADVMIDPVYLLFFEARIEFVLQVAGRLQVVAEGLFDHHPSPASRAPPASRFAPA